MNRFSIILSLFISILPVFTGYAQSYKRGSICLHYTQKEPKNHTRVLWQSTQHYFTNKDTCLQIVVAQASTYQLVIEAEGYQTEVTNIYANDLIPNFIIHIPLQEKRILLKEVTVKRDDRFFYRGDTLVIQTDSIQTKPHSNADELVNKIPGITSLPGGSIQFFGKTVNEITVNGKTMFGGDAKATLSALKSEMVQQFEIIKSTQAVQLNIKLKEDKQRGWYGESENKSAFMNYNLFTNRINNIHNKRFFNVFATSNTINETALSEKDETRLYDRSFANFNGVYSIIDNMDNPFLKEHNRRFELYTSNNYEGTINTQGGGLNYSNSFEKWDIYGFALLNNNNQYLHQDKSLARTAQPFLQNQQSVQDWYNTHMMKQLSFSLSFKPNQAESFRFSQTLLNKTANDFLSGNTTNQLLTYERKQAPTTLTTNLTNTSEVFSLAQQGLWMHRFSKPAQVFSLYISHYYSNERYGQRYFNQLSDSSATSLLTSHNHILGRSTEQTLQLQASQSIPLSKSYLLESKFAYIRENYTLDQQAQQLTALWPIYRSDLSTNPFSVSDQQYSLRMSILYTIPHLKAVFGVKAWNWYSDIEQDGSVQLSKQAITIQPQAYLQYSTTRNLKLSLLYNQDNKTPEFKNLTPLIDSSNFEHISYGNPTLSNYLQHNFEASFSTVLRGSHNLSLNIRYRILNHPIATVAQYGGLGYSIASYEQLANASQADISTVWVRFSRSKAIGFHLINFAGYTNTPTLINNTSYYFKNYYTIINCGIKLNLKNDVHTNFDLQYSSFFSVNTLRNYSSRFQLTPSLEKSFINKTFLRLSTELLIGQNNKYFFANKPIINLSAYHYFLKSDKIKVGFDVRNLLNVRQIYESRVSINEQSQQFTNRLPRMVMLNITFYLEKWYK